jgi:hypothetical protein
MAATGTRWVAARPPPPPRAAVQQANVLTPDKVAAMFVFHSVSPLVICKEVDYAPESHFFDLVDLSLISFVILRSLF